MSSPTLQQRIQIEREKRRRTRARMHLMDFVPSVTPRWKKPEHLAPIVEVLNEAKHKPIRALFSVPPQFGKSETTKHASVQWLVHDPEQNVIYSTYAQGLALSHSRATIKIAKRAGVQLQRGSSAVDHWYTEQGGSFRAAGVGVGITGFPGQKIVFDDPYKNRQEAESEAVRQAVWDHYSSTLESRMHPGSSFFIFHTRWVENDLIGTLKDQKNRDGSMRWEYINLPAINGDGTALWPEGRPLEWLLDKKVGMSDYDWWALWMGDPRPRGRTLFRAPQYYASADRPTSRIQVLIGADFAYSTKKKSDWSVALVLMQHGSGEDALWYVVDLVRVQVGAPVFQAQLRELSERWNAEVFAYIGGGAEKGIGQFMAEDLDGSPLNIVVQSTTEDKYTRAQATARAWNMGRILVPSDAPWAKEFVHEVTHFTGSDAHDDQVDALTGGFDRLVATGVVSTRGGFTIGPDMESQGIG